MSDAPPAPRAPGVAERLGLWVGLLGSIITVGLTIWNAKINSDINTNKGQIDAKLAAVEESKERVERFKWVQSLISTLDNTDEKTRTYNIALIKLALSPAEAEALFSGLQSSTIAVVQTAANQGLALLKTDDGLDALVAKLNGPNESVRKGTLSNLMANYNSSARAVSAALALLSKENASQLTAQGAVNLLTFLNATTPDAWTKASGESAAAILADLLARPVGPQSQALVKDAQKKLAQQAVP